MAALAARVHGMCRRWVLLLSGRCWVVGLFSAPSDQAGAVPGVLLYSPAAHWPAYASRALFPLTATPSSGRNTPRLAALTCSSAGTSPCVWWLAGLVPPPAQRLVMPPGHCGGTPIRPLTPSAPVRSCQDRLHCATASPADPLATAGRATSSRCHPAAPAGQPAGRTDAPPGGLLDEAEAGA